MAKITSFYDNAIYLVQSGPKNILVISEKDSWNFGIDYEKNRPLTAKEMLEILKEPIVEDNNKSISTEERDKIFQDIILKNPKSIHLVYGGWLDVPKSFFKNLKEYQKDVKLEKDAVKKNWDRFSETYKHYEDMGVNPLKNKKAMEHLESILSGKPYTKDYEGMIKTIEHLSEIDPEWIKELGFDIGFDFENQTNMSFYLHEARALLSSIKVITKGDWKTTDSGTMAEAISSAFKRARINVPKTKIIISGPVDKDDPSTTRLVSLVGITKRDVINIASHFKLQADDVFTGKDIPTPSLRIIPNEYQEKKTERKKEPKSEKEQAPKEAAPKKSKPSKGKEKKIQIRLFGK